MKGQKVCEHFSEDLVLLAYDELDESRKKELKKHLAGCLSCQTELSKLKIFKKEVKNAFDADEFSENFLQSNLESIKSAVSNRRSSKSWIPRFAGAAAAACIITITLVIGTNTKKTSTKRPDQIVASSIQHTIRNGTDDNQIVAQIEILENLDVLENILNIVEEDKIDQG